MSFITKIETFMEEKANPVFARFASLPYIQSLNRAFMTLIPLTMVGAFSALFAGLAWDPYQEFIANFGIYDVLILFNNLTNNMYAVWVSGAVAYYYAKNIGLKSNPLILVFVSIFAFFLLAPYTVTEDLGNVFEMTYLGSQGLFTAMVMVFIVVRIYKFCEDKNIRIKMPDSVPNYISDSFSAIIPAVLVAVLFTVAETLAESAGYVNVSDVVYSVIAMPLMGLTNSTVGIVILMALPSLFWFFGIHGASATSAIIIAVLMPPTLENIAAYAAGEAVPNMISYGMGNLGGGGCLIWTLLCLRSKQERFRTLGKLAAVPALFDVSEPYNFGLPLVLNGYLFIPQMILAFLTTILYIVFCSIGILPYAHSMYVWGLPVFVSGFYQSGIMGVVFQIVNLTISYFICLPFFKAYEKSVENERRIQA